MEVVTSGTTYAGRFGLDTVATHGMIGFPEGISIGIGDDQFSKRRFGYALTAPTTGQHAVGEFYKYAGTDTTIAGFRCIVTGRPGTWLTERTGNGATGGAGSGPIYTLTNVFKTGFDTTLFFPSYDTTLVKGKAVKYTDLKSITWIKTITDSSREYSASLVGDVTTPSDGQFYGMSGGVRGWFTPSSSLTGLRTGNINYSTSSTTISPTGTASPNGMYWDNTNNRLLINKTSGSFSLDVTGNGRFTAALQTDATLTVSSTIFQSTVYQQATGSAPWFVYQNYWNDIGSFEFKGGALASPTSLLKLDGSALAVIIPTLTGTGNRNTFLDNNGQLKRGTIDPADIATLSINQSFTGQKTFSGKAIFSAGRADNSTQVSDVNYTQTSSDFLIAYTAITASRTVTLNSSGVTSGQHFVIKDQSGSASNTNTIVISGTVDGAVNPTAVNSAYGVYKFYWSGSAWYKE
jgi:hypothetical protein